MDSTTSVRNFFAEHPVFRTEEFDAFKADTTSSLAGIKSVHLSHYVLHAKRLLQVQPDLYAVIPEGHSGEWLKVDPLLIAARFCPDATLTHHSALQFHGLAQSEWQKHTIQSNKLEPGLTFRGVSYHVIVPPSALKKKNLVALEIQNGIYQGLGVSATSLERTLVDCLSRPQWGGDFDEVWEAYEKVPSLDLERLVRYTLALSRQTTTAKVGYFLEQTRNRWGVNASVLQALEKGSPKNLNYWDKHSIGMATTVSRWKLLVPRSIMKKTSESFS